MENKKMTKAAKRRLFLLGIPATLFIIYFIYTAITLTYDILVLQHQEHELKEQLDLLKANEEDLKIELVKLNNPEYIARYARENYLYSKDGEYIIKIEKNKIIPKTTSSIEDTEYQYLFIGASIIIIVFIAYKIKTKKKTK